MVSEWNHWKNKLLLIRCSWRQLGWSSKWLLTWVKISISSFDFVTTSEKLIKMISTRMISLTAMLGHLCSSTWSAPISGTWCLHKWSQTLHSRFTSETKASCWHMVTMAAHLKSFNHKAISSLCFISTLKKVASSFLMASSAWHRSWLKWLRDQIASWNFQWIHFATVAPSRTSSGGLCHRAIALTAGTIHIFTSN